MEPNRDQKVLDAAKRQRVYTEGEPILLSGVAMNGRTQVERVVSTHIAIRQFRVMLGSILTGCGSLVIPSQEYWVREVLESIEDEDLPQTNTTGDPLPTSLAGKRLAAPPSVSWGDLS